MACFSKSHAGFLLTGSLIGAAIALLYAPKSGAQTRKDLSKFSKKTMNQLDDLQEDLGKQVSTWVERGKDVLDDAKKYVEEGRCQMEKLIRRA